MKDTKSTNEEIRQFYHQRAIIEEEYASKLLDLAKRPLAVAELGSLQTSLDMLANETKNIAKSHDSIAQQLKSDLVNPHSQFAETMLSKRRKVTDNFKRIMN